MHQHETLTHHHPVISRYPFIAMAVENNTTIYPAGSADCEDASILANNQTLYVNMRLVILAIHLFVFVHVLTLFQVSQHD